MTLSINGSDLFLRITSIVNADATGEVVGLGLSSIRGNIGYLDINVANPESQLARQFRVPGRTLGLGGSITRDSMIKRQIERRVNVIETNATNPKAGKSLLKDGFEPNC